MPWLLPELRRRGVSDALSIHALLVRSPGPAAGRRHLCRQRKTRPPKPARKEAPLHHFPSALYRGGLRPRERRHVLCTHLHVDHVPAGTIHARGRQVGSDLSQARYLMGAPSALTFGGAGRRRQGPQEILSDRCTDPRRGPRPAGAWGPPLSRPRSPRAHPGAYSGHVSVRS